MYGSYAANNNHERDGSECSTYPSSVGRTGGPGLFSRKWGNRINRKDIQPIAVEFNFDDDNEEDCPDNPVGRHGLSDTASEAMEDHDTGCHDEEEDQSYSFIPTLDDHHDKASIPGSVSKHFTEATYPTSRHNRSGTFNAFSSYVVPTKGCSNEGTPQWRSSFLKSAVKTGHGEKTSESMLMKTPLPERIVTEDNSNFFGDSGIGLMATKSLNATNRTSARGLFTPGHPKNASSESHDVLSGFMPLHNKLPHVTEESISRKPTLAKSTPLLPKPKVANNQQLMGEETPMKSIPLERTDIMELVKIHKSEKKCVKSSSHFENMLNEANKENFAYGMQRDTGPLQGLEKEHEEIKFSRSVSHASILRNDNGKMITPSKEEKPSSARSLSNLFHPNENAASKVAHSSRIPTPIRSHTPQKPNPKAPVSSNDDSAMETSCIEMVDVQTPGKHSHSPDKNTSQEQKSTEAVCIAKPLAGASFGQCNPSLSSHLISQVNKAPADVVKHDAFKPFFNQISSPIQNQHPPASSLAKADHGLLPHGKASSFAFTDMASNKNQIPSCIFQSAVKSLEPQGSSIQKLSLNSGAVKESSPLFAVPTATSRPFSLRAPSFNPQIKNEWVHDTKIPSAGISATSSSVVSSSSVASSFSVSSSSSSVASSSYTATSMSQTSSNHFQTPSSHSLPQLNNRIEPAVVSHFHCTEEKKQPLHQVSNVPKTSGQAFEGQFRYPSISTSNTALSQLAALSSHVMTNCQPAVSCGQHVVSSGQPAISNGQAFEGQFRYPSISTSVAALSQPAALSSHAMTKSQPAVSSGQNAVSSGQNAVSSGQPAVSNGQPLTNTHPNTSNSQPLLLAKNNPMSISQPPSFVRPSSLPMGTSTSGVTSVVNPSMVTPSMVTPSMAVPSVSQPVAIQQTVESAMLPPSRVPEHVANVVPMSRPVPVATNRKMIMVNQKYYEVLRLLGMGASSKVYDVLDCQTNRCVAVKRVILRKGDPSVEGYLKEVELLNQLKGSECIIRLIDSEMRLERERRVLYMVMERGEMDLSTSIKLMSVSANQLDPSPVHPGGKIPTVTVIYYWVSMLNAVDEIHRKGIVHSDLKPANFLLVGGHVKLIDFGIATSVQVDATSVVKDDPAGTPNYMSPEAIGLNVSGSPNAQNMFKNPKASYKSDVWSLGCILYSLVYGRSPFQHIKNERVKLDVICNPKYAIPFPTDCSVHPPLLRAMKRCLVRNCKERAAIAELKAIDYLCGNGLDEESWNSWKAVATEKILSALSPDCKLKAIKVIEEVLRSPPLANSVQSTE